MPISSVRQSSATIGRAEIRVLLEESEELGLVPQQTVFQPELVVCRSTAVR